MARKKVEHTFIENLPSGQYRMYCTNCGREYVPGLPVSMDMFLTIIKQFNREHKSCPTPNLNTKETKDHEDGKTELVAEKSLS